MKIFNVPAGTNGYVIDKHSVKSSHVTRKALCFDREEVLMDTVIRNNCDTYSWCKDMEQKGYNNEIINLILNWTCSLGYTTFEREGYLLMIHDHELEVQ